MTRMLVALALVVGLATAARAQDADPKAKAAAEYAEGQQLYSAQSYAAAAAKFKAAWALDPDPAYLFNIAQALRFAKQCGEAADYYRKFLAQVTSAPNLDKVHEYLAEVEACAKAQPPPPPPPKDQAPVSSGGGGTLGFVIGGVGLVALGAGAWFHWDAHYWTGRHEDYYTPCKDGVALCSNDILKRINDHGHRAQTLAIAFDVVGGAALAGGIYFYIRGRHGGEQPPVAIVPTSGGAMVTSAFSF